MVKRKGLGQANTFRTNNNTSTGYGVAYADEVSGHRTVGSLADLYVLHDWQLSASGENTDNDAIGQLWYVVNADGNGNGCYYQLKDWSKRNEAAGWSIADYTTKAELGGAVENINTELDKKEDTTNVDQKLSLKADLEQFNNTVSGINANIATKANAQDVTNAIGELQDKIGDRVVVSGNVTNNPDEEDITTEGDTPQTQVLKLKDRAYDSLNASGKGYKILRKNWQPINGERKNVLIQDMINEPNTIYEIRYDFDLNGAEIEVKEGCVLNFVGGSLDNGTIIVQNTMIINNMVEIFKSGLTISGVLKTKLYPEWFGAKGDGIHDDTISLNKIAVVCDNNTIVLSQNKTYLIEGVLLSNKNNVRIIGNGVLKRKDNSSERSLLEISNCSNIYVEDIHTDGNVNGNGKEVNQSQHSISIRRGSKNIYINTICDVNPSGDTLYINDVDGVFINSIFSISDCYTGRNALSIIKGTNINIGYVLSKKTGHSTMPGGIDIEPNSIDDNISNVFINNADIYVNSQFGFNIAGAKGNKIKNINANIKLYKESHTYTNSIIALVNFTNSNISCYLDINSANITTTNRAVLIEDSHNNNIEINIEDCVDGILFSKSTETLIKGEIKKSDNYGVSLVDVHNCIIDMRLNNIGQKNAASAIFISEAAKPSTEVLLKGDFSKSVSTISNSKCILIKGENNSITAQSVNMSGWEDGCRVNVLKESCRFFAYNCNNYNIRETLSGNDYYEKGTNIHVNPDTALSPFIVLQSGIDLKTAPINLYSITSSPVLLSHLDFALVVEDNTFKIYDKEISLENNTNIIEAFSFGRKTSSLGGHNRNTNLKECHYSYLNASSFTSLSNFFNECRQLKCIGDIADWDVHLATTTKSMFGNCVKLKYIGDISQWAVGNIIDARYMFYGCSSLYSIGIPEFNKGCDVSGIFEQCVNLQEIINCAKIHVSLDFSACPLNADSILKILKNLSNEFAESPTITFNSEKYKTFTDYSKGQITEEKNKAEAIGWTINGLL